MFVLFILNIVVVNLLNIIREFYIKNAIPGDAESGPKCQTQLYCGREMKV